MGNMKWVIIASYCAVSFLENNGSSHYKNYRILNMMPCMCQNMQICFGRSVVSDGVFLLLQGKAICPILFSLPLLLLLFLLLLSDSFVIFP